MEPLALGLSDSSTLLLCGASIVAPCQLDIIEIEIGQLSINCSQDLNSRQVTEILSELDIGQFAASRCSAWWYDDILISGPYDGTQLITVHIHLAVRSPFVLAADPKRKGVDPESTVKCSRSGAELSNQLEARTRGSIDVEAIPDSIDGKLRR